MSPGEDGSEAGPLEALLAARIGDRGQGFVFPSQSVADAWAAAAPRRFGVRAVEADRFLGWDRFRDSSLAARRTGKPADDFVHLVWAASVVARQREAPFLRRIAGPGSPSEAFVPFFAKLPASLEKVRRAAASASPMASPMASSAQREIGQPGIAQPSGLSSGGRDEALLDLLDLRDDYAAFMGRHGLYEPAWEAITVPPGDGRWLIIAPELMEDFEGYRAGLAALAPRVEIAGIGAIGSRAKQPTLYKFDNSFEELRWTFLEIGRLLDAGTPPQDIVVTVADLESARPFLSRAAALAGVQADIKGGKPLAASPFGRLLSEIGGAAAGGFDFEPLRALLLDRFATWRQADAVRNLLEFGIERHAYASYSSRGKMVDIWEASFDSAPGTGGLREFYRRLKRSLLCMSAAASFANLRIAIIAFRREFLDEDGLSEAERHEIERAMAELSGLAAAERDYADEGPLPSPFGLFLKALESTTYVPQGAGGAGIAVYSYRVSALHPARRHFVLGASQDGVEVTYPGLPFLREDQKARLGAPDGDASPHFALAYSISGCGASFSYAVESFSGWSVPHPALIGVRTGDKGNSTYYAAQREMAPPPGFAEARAACPLSAEAAAWRGESALPPRLLGFQRDAFAAARPSLVSRAPRYGESLASSASLGALLPRMTRRDGLIRASATMIDEYSDCPFSWLLGRCLGLEEEPSGVGFFDALLAGEMAHDALRSLLDAMRDLGPIEARHIGAYRAAAKAAVRGVLPAFERKEGPFLVPMFEAYAPLLEDRLGRLVEALVAEPGWEAGELEAAFEKPYPNLGAALEGRIDRLARRADGGECAIIDYKKRTLPKVAALKPGPDGELGDYQMPAYVAICEAAGRKVGAASYWSIEDAKWLRAMGPGGEVSPDREGYAPEMDALEDALGRVIAGLRAGDFRPSGGRAADGGADAACEGCGWKAVCRKRYATE